MKIQWTDKQRLFVKEYLVDLDATAAGIRAGYTRYTAAQCRGWINGDTRDSSSRPHIWDAVRVEMIRRMERVEVDQDYVIRSLMRESEVGADTTPSSRVSALNLLGKHLKMYTDRTEHLGADGKPLIPDVIKVIHE